MGTYRQPSQVLDQTGKAFNDAYVARRAEIEKQQAAQLAYAQKLFKQQSLNVDKATKDKAKADSEINKLKVKSAKANLFGTSNPLAFKVVSSANGKAQIMDISEDDKGIMARYQYIDVNDSNNDGSTTDVIVDNEYWDSLDDDDKTRLENYSVRVYEKPKVSEGAYQDNAAYQDVAFDDWYNKQLELGIQPFGVGVQGSLEEQINEDYKNMATSNTSSSEYLEAKGDIETAIELVPLAQGVMDTDKGNYSSIWDYTQGKLKSLDQTGAVVLRNSASAGGGKGGFAIDANYVKMQNMRLSFAVDQITGNNKYRTSAILTPGDLQYTYKNDILGEEFNIDYQKYAEWIEHRGYGIIETLNTEKADEWMNTGVESISNYFKNLPTITTSNTWTSNGKTITKVQARKLFEEAEAKAEAELYKYFSGNSFSGSNYAQHVWQSQGGATNSGLGLYYDATNPEMVNYLVTKAMELNEASLPPRSNGTNTKISYKEAKESAGAGASTIYGEKDIEINPTSKFTRAGNKYSLKEILQIQPNLNASETASLLMDVKDSNKTTEYYSGKQLKEAYPDEDLTSLEDEGIYKFTKAQMNNGDFRGLPVNINGSGEIIPLSTNKFLQLYRGATTMTNSQEAKVKKLINKDKVNNEWEEVDILSQSGGDYDSLYESLISTT